MCACRKCNFSGLLAGFVLALALMLPVQAHTAGREGFVHVTDMCANVILEIRYFSAYNFVGKRIDGYAAPQAILSEPAAKALCKAAAAAEQKGYVVKIFDAYRSQAAVDRLVRWGKVAADLRM